MPAGTDSISTHLKLVLRISKVIKLTPQLPRYAGRVRRELTNVVCKLFEYCNSVWLHNTYVSITRTIIPTNYLQKLLVPIKLNVQLEYLSHKIYWEICIFKLVFWIYWRFRLEFTDGISGTERIIVIVLYNTLYIVLYIRLQIEMNLYAIMSTNWRGRGD